MTILNCSVVCRDWLPACRLRLFRQIVLNGADQYDRFYTAVICTPSMQPWLSHIHQITMFDVEDEDSEDEEDQPTQTSRIVTDRGRRTQRFVHAFANRLPILQSLRLSHANWIAFPPHPSAWRTFSSFPALRHLELEQCKLPSLGVLCRMLVALPILKRLVLRDVEWPPTRHILTYTSGTHRTYPALVHLSVKQDMNECMVDFLTWLTLTPTKNSIKVLDLHPGSTPWSDSCVNVLQILGPSLMSFERPKLSAGTRAHYCSTLSDLHTNYVCIVQISSESPSLTWSICGVSGSNLIQRTLGRT